jgi:Leucine-rich repeat (LRR) protein
MQTSKAALLANVNINTNLDGEIQCTEASAYTGAIIVPSLSIADLTGIEAFTSITLLACNSNDLTSLNVSSNTALTNLNCDQNDITSLDVSAFS